MGWPISELLDRQIAEFFGLETLLDAYDRAPSLLNGGLERVSPVWWGTCLGLTAAIDLDGIAKSRAYDPEYFPGKLDFDPWNLYPKDKAGRARMELGTLVDDPPLLWMLSTSDWAKIVCCCKLLWIVILTHHTATNTNSNVTAEIKHGRLAMLAVAAFGLQEYATRLGVIDETPFFFFPLNESLERMGMV